MKIAFIGGLGHHYLRGLLPPAQTPVPMEFACAGDGHDDLAAKKWAEANHVSRWFDSPDALYTQFEPDAVSVGSIYARNSELTAQALEKNIPVVSDKPIATTWQQLDRLKQLTDDRARIVLTEFDFRCRPDFRAAQAAIAAGKIGQVILVSAQKSYRFGTRPKWYADRAQYGGTLLWIASHAIDATEWVTGRKIRRAVGHQGNLSHPEYGTMEDHLSVLLELENGGTGVVHADFLRPAAAATHGDDRMRVAGSEGVVEVRDGRCKLITKDAGETDITESVVVRPIHLELLAALRGEKSEWFSTEQSMEMAETLLSARDATDEGKWKTIQNSSTAQDSPTAPTH
jgi:predicted dehydrogenase